eukprot:COSAG06_NODE_937_length_11402_cov_4.495709_6_plen_86_part_00
MGRAASISRRTAVSAQIHLHFSLDARDRRGSADRKVDLKAARSWFAMAGAAAGLVREHLVRPVLPPTSLESLRVGRYAAAASGLA